MKKRSTMSLLFFIKKSKLLKNGEAPIYMRISVNTKRAEIALKISISSDMWSSDAGMAKQNCKKAREVNKFLDVVKVKLHDNYRQLLEDRKEISIKTLKNAFLGIKENEKTLVEIFNIHNENMKKLVGIDFAPGSLQRYEITLRHVKDYLFKKFKIDDIELLEINNEFITNFEMYLRVDRECSHNTSMKYMRGLKKVIRIALSNDWIKKDPFMNYKITIKKTDRGFLNDEELETLMNKSFSLPRLEQIKDCFIFSCFTGLAHSDLKRLTSENIVTGSDGNKWIKINRQKTKMNSSIPLLTVTQELIDKYKNHPYCQKNKVLLPVLSNQKMNAYLKEIADLCGITKNLTSHLARHTFATTVTLNNDVPIESVSKMLGHSSIKMTNIYARLLDKKVSKDMSKLQGIYG